MLKLESFSLIQFQHGHKGGLRHFDCADLAHSLLALLLLFEQLSLSCDVTAVTLGCHVLADGLDGLAGDDLGTYSGLDGDVELLTRDEFLEFFADFASEIVGVIHVD